MSKKIELRDEGLNTTLLNKGYAVIPSFLSAGQIDNLLKFYSDCNLDQDKTQPNYLYLNPEKSFEINRYIKSQIEASFDENFNSGNLLGGVFMIKKPGENREVDFHQDWSLVDETQHISYNLWCPLTNVTKDSGALMIIDKSDKAGLPYRSSTFPPLEIGQQKKYTRFIKNFNLKAGDAIVYKHSLFHGSGNNNSPKDRIAIACGIIPENAAFIYQHWNENTSTIESYEVDQSFYIRCIHDVLSGKIPEKYKCIKKVPMTSRPEISEAVFYKKLRKVHGVKRFIFFDF